MRDRSVGSGSGAGGGGAGCSSRDPRTGRSAREKARGEGQSRSIPRRATAPRGRRRRALGVAIVGEGRPAARTLSQKKCRLWRNPAELRYPALFRTRSARITACASRSAGRSTLTSLRSSFPTLCRTTPTRNIATVMGISTQFRIAPSRRMLESPMARGSPARVPRRGARGSASGETSRRGGSPAREAPTTIGRAARAPRRRATFL